MRCFNCHGEEILLLNSWTLLPAGYNTAITAPRCALEPLGEPSPSIEADQSKFVQTVTYRVGGRRGFPFVEDSLHFPALAVSPCSPRLPDRLFEWLLWTRDPEIFD